MSHALTPVVLSRVEGRYPRGGTGSVHAQNTVTAFVNATVIPMGRERALRHQTVVVPEELGRGSAALETLNGLATKQINEQLAAVRAILKQQ